MKNITLVNINDVKNILCEFCDTPLDCKKSECDNPITSRINELKTIEMMIDKENGDWL